MPIILCGAALLYGCSLAEYTDAPELSYLAGKRFELRNDAFVFTRRCPREELGRLLNWEKCNAIQIPGGCLPESYSTYENNKQKSEDYLTRCLEKVAHSFGESEIVGYLEKGSVIQVANIYTYSIGAESSHWIIKAVIQSGNLKGTKVELPSSGYRSGPKWFSPVSPHQGVPVQDVKYIGDVQK